MSENIISDDILTLLEQQRENFSQLHSLVKSKDIKPAVVFLPQTLKLLDQELTSKSDLILDCLNYLDVVKIYSISVYGDPDTYLNSIMKVIVKNRSVINLNYSIAKDAVDDFIFAKSEEAHEFLENNKLLLAIYLYSLIEFIFYTSE